MNVRLASASLVSAAFLVSHFPAQNLVPLSSQVPSPAPAQLAPAQAQVVEKAVPAVAIVLGTQSPTETATSRLGTALVVRPDGVLLTAYHVVKDAHALQVRFKSGEAFDQVQLLGVDARRDVAAIRITASGLPVLPVVSAARVSPGDAVITVSHPQALPWSVSSGVFSAYRMADEVPDAGKGYRILQFTAPTSPGSSGGVLLDAQGRALGLIVGSLAEGQNLNFAVPLESVLGLADSAPGKTFASGSALDLPYPAAPPTRSALPAAIATAPGEDKSRQSDRLSGSINKEDILRNFRTMYVDAENASFFGNEQMKAALGRNKDFAALNIHIVDDRSVADVILVVGYTFAWDYPFTLRHQNTSLVLLSGKGSGPFSGPAGAASVAKEFSKLARPYRTTPEKKKQGS